MKRFLTTGLLACALAGLAGCATTFPPAPATVDNADYNYLIGPGDSVNIVVWRNPELSMTVPVRPDGKITAPLVEDLPNPPQATRLSIDGTSEGGWSSIAEMRDAASPVEEAAEVAGPVIDMLFPPGTPARIPIAAVTGTSGKTSVASFTRQIWAHAGRKAASIGTLGLVDDDAGPWALIGGSDGALLAVYAAHRGDTVKPSFVMI